MSMSLKLTKKQVKRRSAVVSISMMTAFVLSLSYFKTTFFTAAGIGIVVYVGAYAVFEVYDYRKCQKLLQSGIKAVDTMDGY